MTSTPIPVDAESIEPDLDDWLNGGQRKAHFVALYSRADLYAEIEMLQRQIVPVQKVHEDDVPMAGAEDPNAELTERINTLWHQLDDSKREFRVEARTPAEMDVIIAEVREELKDEIDKTAAKGREDGKTAAKRMGITTAVDINNLVRGTAAKAVAELVDREVSIRAIADGTSMLVNDKYVPVTRAQMRKLSDKLGGAQMDALNRAYDRAANEAPAVSLPK